MNKNNKTLKYILINILFFTFYSCQQPTQEEKIIIKYFQKNNISDNFNDYKYLIFFPSNQCQTCFRINGNKFINHELDSILILSEFKGTAFENIPHFYLEKNSNISKMKWVDYKNKIVKINNGKIVDIKTIDFKDVSNINNIIRSLQ